MADFRDALLNMTENALNDAVTSVFLNNKTAWVQEITDSYVKYGTKPNDTISKLAAEYKLNGDQVQRLVEEANVSIYLNKYAATKGQKVRRVEFDLADPQQITTHASTSTMGAGLEKAASATEYLNAFTTNSDEYQPSMWDGDAMRKTAATMIKRKLAPRLEQEKKAAIGRVKQTLSKIATIAEALVYNERAEGTAGELLTKLAADADLTVRDVTAITRYAMKKVAQHKEAKRLPNNFTLDLTKTSTSCYSLGKHSLLKEAEEYVVKAKHLPDMVSYEKLVEIAREVKKELDAQGTKELELKVVR